MRSDPGANPHKAQLANLKPSLWLVFFAGLQDRELLTSQGRLDHAGWGVRLSVGCPQSYTPYPSTGVPAQLHRKAQFRVGKLSALFLLGCPHSGPDLPLLASPLMSSASRGTSRLRGSFPALLLEPQHTAGQV